ncbi:MAG: hypothetical protein K1X81_13010 [Bacteroidia bacterium]|nr:hypothetical protein [Bacteroidia bacterium]
MKNYFFLFLLGYSFTSMAQNRISVTCGLVSPMQRHKYVSDLFNITQYPKLTPVVSYGFGCIIDSSKSVSLVLEGNYRGGKAKGFEYEIFSGSNSTYADLKYDVASLSLVGRFALTRNKKWFALVGISYNSCFREVTTKRLYTPNPIWYSDIFDQKDIRNGKTGFTGGIGYNYHKLTTQVKVNLIKNQVYPDSYPYFIDHSSLSFDMSYAFHRNKAITKLPLKDSSHRNTTHVVLYGLRLGVVSTIIDSSNYNSDKLRIDFCKRASGGIELSFFIIPKITRKVSLVTETGIRCAHYHVSHRPVSPYPSFEIGYNLQHYLWTINVNAMLRFGIGKNEAFYFQTGAGTTDLHRYKAKGEHYGAPTIGWWEPNVSAYTTKEINDFPLGISRRNALLGFGFQRIKIGNRRLFAEMRVSVPLNHSGILFKERDNVVTSVSIGYFFNKF